MRHRLLFTSDIHGNTAQYRKLVDYAIKTSADSVIIGGDIAPLLASLDLARALDLLPAWQRVFLEEELPSLLRPLQGRCNTYLIMGNDDCAANMDALQKSDPDIAQVIHGKRIELTEDFDLVGYSFVPITPFLLKDWEKFDLSRVPDDMVGDFVERIYTNCRLAGYKSTESGWRKFKFTPESTEDSIQNDLDRSLFCEDADRTIYVFHAPPNDTNLDVGLNKIHLGSMALRLFIEQHQPYMTLHGHIHETVECSGDFRQRIGKAVCLAAGNDHYGSELSVLVIDLPSCGDARRVMI